MHRRVLAQEAFENPPAAGAGGGFSASPFGWGTLSMLAYATLAAVRADQVKGAATPPVRT